MRRERSSRGVGLRERFAGLIVGATVASLVWLTVVTMTATSPEQAFQDRASPDLPAPTVALRSTVLRQYSWFDCSREAATTVVSAPQVPLGFRSVVTEIRAARGAVKTGMLLASVGGQPLFAVVTNGVLYRDLVVGDRGADVVAFERALSESGWVGSPDSVMDEAAVTFWNNRTGKVGSVDRIRLATLVAVPRSSSLAARQAAVGDDVKRGETLLRLQADSRSYRCPKVDGALEVTPGNATLEVSGRRLRVGSIRVTSTGDFSTVRVEAVKPVRQAMLRLRVERVSTDGPVLAAPLAALKMDEQGDATVVVVHGEGQTTRKVQLGTAAQGLVEISGSGLAEGDLLRLFGVAPVLPPDAPPSTTSGSG